jgi:hypothetical protein
MTSVLLGTVSASAQSRDSLYMLNRDKFIVLKNNKFSYYNSWINLGAGGANNFTQYGRQFTLGADFNFHIRAEYLQLGLFFVGDKIGSYNNFNYHLGYGRRKETSNINFACFAGLAYSTGYKKVNGVFSYGNVYNNVSGYINLQFVKKITYDTGLGLSFFADYSAVQFISGIRLDAYLSGAYKGKARKTKQDE